MPYFSCTKLLSLLLHLLRLFSFSLRPLCDPKLSEAKISYPPFLFVLLAQNVTASRFRCAYLPQSFILSFKVSLNAALVTFLPLTGIFNWAAVTGVADTFVANQVTCWCGSETPNIIPGRPVKDSGPPGAIISSV